MAVNLGTHRLALLTAYQDVIDEATDTDCLCCCEGLGRLEEKAFGGSDVEAPVEGRRGERWGRDGALGSGWKEEARPGA
uniref:Uncharacterized protein n=1 Tax=Knipowitschia caucasica TaxID=637954 RepID=A0AAV2J9W2_KNICA